MLCQQTAGFKPIRLGLNPGVVIAHEPRGSARWIPSSPNFSRA